ncbi:MAG TPA: Ppx/GppA phosphatase family protein [Streptosporangiaceae bacterium]|nr:Ppx/GppA phosphatase family protein [Streptosporangiaceae bacterium]
MRVSAGRATRVAVVDCGTNSLRLLIADVDPASGVLTDVDRRMEIVRLGQGVDATGRLAPQALARTMRMLASYRAAIDAASVSAVRMVATSATRDAANAAEFVAGAVGVLGVKPEVLSGQEEARLSFVGATAELADSLPQPYLVVDIGGGSTEFVLGNAASVTAAASVDIGCVRLTERHLHGDPPTAAEVAAASCDIEAALDKVAATVPASEARTLVGLAGSVTTVAALALGMTGYDPALIHHTRVSAEAVRAQADRLLGMTRTQRQDLGPMHAGRVDVIGGGSLILALTMARFGLAEVLVSEHDILDGIAWSMAGNGHP